MGLDMYLSEERYLSNWAHNEGKDSYSQGEKVLKIIGATDLMDRNTGGVEVKFPVAYWRKANAIHNWFVTYVQNGVDNCASYHVSTEELETLVGRCQAILTASSTGGNWQAIANDPEFGLPPTEGFFFGGTDIENEDGAKWYLADLEGTIEMLMPVIVHMNDEDVDYFDKGMISYQASW
jgi:hypothetical protein